MGEGRLVSLRDGKFRLPSQAEDQYRGSFAKHGTSVYRPPELHRFSRRKLLVPVCPQTVPGQCSRDLATPHFQPGYCQSIQIYRRSEEHTSELQSLMRISYPVFCLTKKKSQI